MEPTITQSGALYLAQNIRAKQRAQFFAQMRSAAREQLGRKHTRTVLLRPPSRHLDNGR